MQNRSRLKKIIFILLFAISNHQILAQRSQISFDHYDINNGLSNDEVKDILQDDDGFIWIATRGGLNRFDGKDFVKFYYDGTPNHLPSNDISRILQFSPQRLVVGTTKGIGIFDERTGLTKQLIIPSALELKLNTNRINDLLVDGNHNIVATTPTGVYLFDSLLHLVFRYDAFLPIDIGKKRIVFGYELNLLDNGDALLQGGVKLLSLDIKRRKLKKVDVNNLEMLNKWNSRPYSLLNFNNRRLGFLVNFDSGKNKLLLNVMNFRGKTTAAIEFPVEIKKEISWKSRILFLNDSVFAINSSFQNGLFLFTVNEQHRILKYSSHILPKSQCNWPFVDNDNRLWIGTDAGLFKQSFRKTAFHNFLVPNIGMRNDIDNHVNGFSNTDSRLFVSVNSQGILVYDSNRVFLKRIGFEKLNKPNLPWAISPYTKDSLLIPTQIGSLLLSTKTQKLKKLLQQGLPSIIDSVATTANLIDSHHQLWMGLGNGFGVFMMNLDNHIWKHYLPKTGSGSFPLRYPSSIHEDKLGNIWMSGVEGITRWSWQKKIFDTLIERIPGIKDNISGQWIYSTTDKDGNLWICPEDFVLVKWNLETKYIKIFKRPGNLVPFRANEISGPWDNHLWVQTDIGLLSFNILDEKFTLLKEADGLPGESASDGGFYYDSISHKMYAGFNKAFTWFYPDDIFSRKISSGIYITDIREIGDTLSYTGKNDLTFSHKNNSISISYTGINFDDGEFNSYAYRLFEEKPSEWINVGDQKTLNFANLKPGNYTFEVKTILSDGTESRRPASFTLTISLAYYQTWWFYILCIIAFAAGIYSLYRYRINQLLRVQKVRNNISSDLHDDIGARLTNINILTMLGKQNLQQPEITSAYLTRIENEIQSSGEALDDIVWSINSRNDSLPEIVARMRRYAADVFETTNTSFKFNSDKQFGNHAMDMEQRRDLFLVYKEAINNIQKHAQATIVNINVSEEKKCICLTITDDGKGFDVAQSNCRNGLKNMRNRIEKWRGAFIMTSSSANGTTINILLPEKYTNR